MPPEIDLGESDCPDSSRELVTFLNALEVRSLACRQQLFSHLNISLRRLLVILCKPPHFLMITKQKIDIALFCRRGHIWSPVAS